MGFVGDTLMDLGVALITVSEAEPLTPLNVALIVAVPAVFALVANPPFTFATFPAVVPQVALAVRSTFEPSL